MKPTTTWILIIDGARARVVQNNGPGKGIEALPELVFDADHRRSADIMSDRPGRTFDSVGRGRHAMEQPQDAHEALKAKFVRKVIDTLEQRSNYFDRLVVIAPPATLGMFRKSMTAVVAGKLTGELDKDLTHVPNEELPGHLEQLVAL